MESSDLKTIEKYKSRLNRNNEFKKVFRTLQRLNELDMTFELLQATGIGKSVNSLRKVEGLGDFAKEIVNKWKKLVKNGKDSIAPHKLHENETYSPQVKSEPVEYDPSGNWELTKKKTLSSPYKPSVKSEPVDTEYDPTQNWKMNKSSEEASNSAGYVPSPSPVKIKQEKSEKSKKRKHENGKIHKIKSEPRDRESEAAESQHSRRTEKKKDKKAAKVKVEKKSPERRHRNSDSNKDAEPEEYDPRDNFQLAFDPGSPDMEPEYEPSSNHSLEYDPGPANSNYQPSSLKHANESSCSSENEEPILSRVTEQDEDSFEEDEPGAYLLHPRRVSFDCRKSNSEDDSSEENELNKSADSSFVSSTTLYSRNKSIDSEDGVWGSNAREYRPCQSTDAVCESKERRTDLTSKSSKIHAKERSTKREPPQKVETSKKEDYLTKKRKKLKHSENLTAGESETVERRHKKELNEKPLDKRQKSKSSEHRDKSGKRRSTSSKESEPAKKKVKSSEVKKEKQQPKDAGFLFEDIPTVSKSKKKKKKSDSVKVTAIPKPAKHVKLDLHLPEIQTSYRPLPHTNPMRSPTKQLTEEQLTDSQAAELHSTRQTKKMQVYSGGTGGFIPKMMSLYDQCMTVLMNNISALDVIGVPYEIIQPVLERCTPEQLYRLEDSNPYLLEDTDELWQKHALREFKGRKREEMECWREMFLRLYDEREAKLQNLTQMIQAKEAKKKPLEKKVLLAYVGTSAKAPRSVRRAQEKYGTALKASRLSSSTSQSSSVRQEINESRMRVPVGAITAATIDAREDRFSRMKEMKKPRVAPMMAKTLKSIGRIRFKR